MFDESLFAIKFHAWPRRLAVTVNPSPGSVAGDGDWRKATCHTM